MSIRPDDFLIYVCELLNIKTESQFTIDKMIESISSIHGEDLPKFTSFVEEHFTDKEYKFFNGPQKFNKIKRDFEYWNRPRLSEKAKGQVEFYATYLFKKTCWLFDRINWQIEAGTHDIKDFQMEKTKKGDELYFSKDDLKHLKAIGTTVDLFNLVKRNKPKLEQEIRRTITSYYLVKNDPRNQIENKTQDQKVIKQLKRRTV